MSLNEGTAPVASPSDPTMAWALTRTHNVDPSGRRMPMTTPTIRRPGRRLAMTGWSSGHHRLSLAVDELESVGGRPVHDVFEVPPDQTHPRRLEHHLEGLVDPHDRPRRVHHQHAVGQRLDDGGLASGHLPQPLLKRRSLGDVPDVDDDPTDGVVQMIGRRHVEVDRGPVRPDRATSRATPRAGGGPPGRRRAPGPIRRWPDRTGRRRLGPTTSPMS